MCNNRMASDRRWAVTLTGDRETAGFAHLVVHFTCESLSGAGIPLAEGPRAAAAAAWELSAFRLPTGLPATLLRPGLGGWLSAQPSLVPRRPPLLPCPCPCLSWRRGLLTPRGPREGDAHPAEAARLPRADPGGASFESSATASAGGRTLPLPSESRQVALLELPALEEQREPSGERLDNGSPRVAHLPRGSRIPSRSSRSSCSCPRSPRASPAAAPTGPRTSARRIPPARTPESG